MPLYLQADSTCQNLNQLKLNPNEPTQDFPNNFNLDLVPKHHKLDLTYSNLPFLLQYHQYLGISLKYLPFSIEKYPRERQRDHLDVASCIIIICRGPKPKVNLMKIK